VSQGWRLNSAIKTTERASSAAANWCTAERPIMAWCVGNAKSSARQRSDLITKQAAGTAKIDPLMAALTRSS
jgi:phage terminase large subunit-like protein